MRLRMQMPPIFSRDILRQQIIGRILVILMRAIHLLMWIVALSLLIIHLITILMLKTKRFMPITINIIKMPMPADQ